MPYRTRKLDLLFHGLADPTRRAVLRRLARGPVPVSDLARPFEMSLPAFTQHLGVLESAGLVRSQKRGRVRTYALSPGALKPAEHWLSKQREMWESRLDQLDSFLSTLDGMENS
jgi:DNA-binding transcriptional ArsR family regulator